VTAVTRIWRAGQAGVGVLATAILGATPAAARELDGSSFSALWALPFVGILLSIALMPLFAAHAWEHHQGKIAALWGLMVAVPLALSRGPEVAAGALTHVLLLDYVPFILLLFALFTAAGGILVSGNLHGSPGTNTALLAVGALLASVIGTTGASMVMIRPVLRANDSRRFNVHVIVFFIFLVSNIGGSLTPLGDPPLFLGFLRGVDFFWITTHVWTETLFVAGLLLAVFYALDRFFWRSEDAPVVDPTPDKPISLHGLVNVALIGVVVAAILASASWRPGVAAVVFGVPVEGQDLARSAVFVLVALLSIRLSDRSIREANGFGWGPISEVAKLFAGIFITMIPVLAMLRAGASSAFAPLVALVSRADGSPDNAAYFWLSGGLSSFLDNAPTYLVFFELAGGDPQHLMGPGARTLAAISCGAVFMGANSYIGNAPNFMVYAIARGAGVRMPSFFGYMLWSGVVLIPSFVLATLVFFR
jgi:Na+/H+ antiporter NhaD/arsenite permease-like protein